MRARDCTKITRTDDDGLGGKGRDAKAW
jgi:hypothetical protein